MAVTYTQNVKSGSSINLVPYSSLSTIEGWVREGYVFIGWNTLPDGSGTSYSDEKLVSFNKDIILYAQWIPEGSVILLESATSENDFIELESGGALLLEN